jgi:hypothetical protein
VSVKITVFWGRDAVWFCRYRRFEWRQKQQVSRKRWYPCVEVIKMVVVVVIFLGCEVLSAVPVLYPSKWSRSFHLFLGRAMLLFPLWPLLLYALSVPIRSTCCSHSRWYCFISRTMFCTPNFSLTDWCLSLSNLVIPNKCLKVLIYAASSLYYLFSSAPRLHYQTIRHFISEDSYLHHRVDVN